MVKCIKHEDCQGLLNFNVIDVDHQSLFTNKGKGPFASLLHVSKIFQLIFMNDSLVNTPIRSLEQISVIISFREISNDLGPLGCLLVPFKIE